MNKAYMRSNDPLAFVRRCKPNRLVRRSLTALNILLSLALAVLIYQSLSLQAGTLKALAIAFAFFLLSAAIVLLGNRMFYSTVDKMRLQDAIVSSDNLDVLQEQLELCLEFGDTEKADKISRKLMRIAEAPDQGTISGNFPM